MRSNHPRQFGKFNLQWLLVAFAAAIGFALGILNERTGKPATVITPTGLPSLK
ncbi:hypothetical protein BH09PSE5_BH09PSE5_38360 [soil metagenome]